MEGFQPKKTPEEPVSPKTSLPSTAAARATTTLSALQATCQIGAIAFFAAALAVLMLTGTLIGSHSVEVVRPLLIIPDRMRHIILEMAVLGSALCMAAWSVIQFARFWLGIQASGGRTGVLWGQDTRNGQIVYATFLLVICIWIAWQMVASL